MNEMNLMLDETLFDEEEIDIRTFDNQDNSIQEKKFLIWKIIFGILCLFLAGEIAYYKLIIPSLSSPKVTVSGNSVYSAQEIAKKLLVMKSKNWFDFDVDQAASILSSEAGLESVIVEKHFPDKILIKVKERQPVAVTFVEEKGHSVPVQIDRNGVIFPSKQTPDTTSMPIVSGLPVEYMRDGMRIPSKYRPLIQQINEIKELPQKYFAAISEICVVPKESGSYELALIPSQSKIRVLTDRSLNEDALQNMMVVLDVVNVLDPSVSEIDLRYGSVSCKSDLNSGKNIR